jgi:hypothetical protein
VYPAHRAVCSASRGQIIIHTQVKYTAAAVSQPASNPNSSEVNQATGTAAMRPASAETMISIRAEGL